MMLPRIGNPFLLLCGGPLDRRSFFFRKKIFPTLFHFDTFRV